MHDVIIVLGRDEKPWDEFGFSFSDEFNMIVFILSELWMEFN